MSYLDVILSPWEDPLFLTIHLVIAVIGLLLLCCVALTVVAVIQWIQQRTGKEENEPTEEDPQI